MKNFVALIIIATSLFAGSCQRESYDSAHHDSTVTFSVEIPEVAATKAYGDGANINNLICAVYKTTAEDERTAIANISSDDIVKVYNEEKTFDDGNAHITIELINDQNYVILFWAQVKDTWVSGTDIDLTNVTYPGSDTEPLVANNDKYSAFSGVSYIAKVKGNRTAPVSLSRPFAQINIASVSPEGYDLTGTKSSVTISGAAESFNVATQTASNETTTVTYNTASSPAGPFNDTYRQYLAMNYVFVNGNVSVGYTLETKYGNMSTMENPITNVPVAKNHRTNIVGNLLTSDIEYNMTLEDWGTPDDEVQVVSDYKEVLNAIKNGGQIKLIDDIQIQSTLDIKADVDVYLDLNGKKISVDAADFEPNSNGSQYVFIIREGGSLVIDGEGTVETTTPAPIMFYPAGDLVIENGTFIRNIPEGYTGSVGNMFVGTKPSGGWHSAGVKINGGYFDSGYYREGAVHIEDYLNNSKAILETETDIQKRGQPGDPNTVRGALKDNISKMFNKSNNYFLVYGGTFVGANPAWGDEGCMLPTTPQYLRPWSYYQGAFLDGQRFHEDGIVLPDGYTISQSTHADGRRPIYTVEYTEPDSDAITPDIPNE